MKTAAKFFLIPILFMIASKANAKVEWNEPDVVPEKLVRKNRRVLRFSGVTTPGAYIRIRKNRLKLYLNDGKTRLAKIPQKNRVQFPVVADSNGYFTFDLYLPTVAVEIPIEMKEKKKWKPYTLNFRVPDNGSANDFQAIEESFQDQDARMESRAPRENYYSRKNDRGLQLRDRGGELSYKKSNIQAWGGLGLSYFNTDVGIAWTPGAEGNNSASTIVLPTWRLGADWDYSKKLRLKGTIRSTSGSTDDIGNAQTQGKDFNWFEAQIAGIYFSDMLAMKAGRLGFDLGFQIQTVPYLRYRVLGAGFAQQTTYFDNELYNLHLGVHFEKTGNKTWNYEAYARYLYSIASGDSFDVDSFPLNFEFGGGIRRPLTSSLALGVFGQLNYFSMSTKYSSGVQTQTADLSLMLLTVDVRLIANF